MKTDSRKTYRQYLSARNLGDALLMKHAQESSQGSIVLYSDPQIEKAFQVLAVLLGYTVEPIQAPAVTEAA